MQIISYPTQEHENVYYAKNKNKKTHVNVILIREIKLI